ncbi:MAG: sarcosine oxidase subunit gamma [Rhodobacteraceae bacterium]|nr:sarcosine oxidase subunit gamma [Paracoccaceae bacterium]
MVSLIAQTPWGALPLVVGPLELHESAAAHMTLLAPYRGRHAALSAALQQAFGLTLPGPNQSHANAGARLIWFAQGQVMLMGTPPFEDLAEHAAVIDQSDGWAALALHGPKAEDVLARLVPLDLRSATPQTPEAFAIGATARSLLQHMTVSITKTKADGFLILAPRSMAQTLLHELHEAAKNVMARAQQRRLGEDHPIGNPQRP